MTLSSAKPGAATDALPAAPASLGSELLGIARRAAQAAGAELLARADQPHRVSTKSSPTDLVSEADSVAETVIRETLLGARPDDGFVGEEGSRDGGSTGITWVVDPLDGTVNYLFGDREWSVSIAAVDADGPLVGAVIEPVTGRMWTGIRGEGAWRDDVEISARRTPELADAMVLAGLSYDAAQRRRQMEMFTDVAPGVRDLRRHGSAALELCRVAEGTADAYVESPIFRWDIAAGALIAREAGARVHVTHLDEVRRSVLAATPFIFEELLMLLQTSDFGAEFFNVEQVNPQ
ncbi:inositol monophosphatase [Protaetiibacter sp. SSC-01]|uniref:inositol monophosphatase family protein n=1 Tax=Protaetiibacter sp. SSC-01 TaxID=2759943 RepID=UPI00165704B0|nr:inositol monophosphatase family protein [Protaetiibacter sp. SSC-01]QNO37818.1 inositol monophosphatase [Protaetiibacter sp. SSC-01]